MILISFWATDYSILYYRFRTRYPDTSHRRPMNDDPCNILIIEDNPFDFKLTSKLITKSNDRYFIEWANTLEMGLHQIRH